MTTSTAVDDERRQAYETLTPLQQLILEVLAARYRLGHELWTFTLSSAVSRAMKELVDQGLIEKMHGAIQGTVRALLTEDGKKLILDPNYAPPARPLRQRGRGDECSYCDDLKDHPNGPCTHWYG